MDDELLTDLERLLGMSERFVEELTADERDEWQRISATVADRREWPNGPGDEYDPLGEPHAYVR